MDSSDEETFALMLLLKCQQRKRKRKLNKRSMWCREHYLLRNELGEFHRTYRHLLDHPDADLFFNYVRMSYKTFAALKSLVLHHLEPTGSNWRTPISGEEKLILTLRHLATGSSFASMSVPFHMSKTSISRHVLATCQVLWDVLQPLELPIPTKEDWRRLAKRFGDLWDYPFVIGALDGKHIALVNPANSGSMYYNYKGFPSIVLLALSDADSCFILVDCGQYGRVSDAGVYQDSKISKLLQGNRLNIPTETFKVNATDEHIPFLIVADEAFPLKAYLLRPFAARTLDNDKRIYNYRHSRARRTVECAFGILSRKFEIFQRPMRIQPDNAVIMTNAATALHNFIRRRDGHLLDRTSDLTYDKLESTGDGLLSLRRQAVGRVPDAAIAIRDTITKFFNDPEGSVSWQNEHVFRNVMPHTQTIGD